MNLPIAEGLDVTKFVRMLNDTTTSYKFIVLQALLYKIKSGRITEKNRSVTFSEIAIHSISSAWFSIVFYKLNYGSTDKLAQNINNIRDHQLFSNLKHNDSIEVLTENFKAHENMGVISNTINWLERYVPYRLLSPWLQEEVRDLPDAARNNRIRELSQNKKFQCLYSISLADSQMILTFNREWVSYLTKNMVVIEAWAKFKFVQYLQKRNPTAIGLIHKLDAPVERNIDEARRIFGDFFETNPNSLKCFYSGEILESDGISYDHFVPWSFIASDPIYNFVPTTRSINSEKSNRLPDRNMYLERLAIWHLKFYKFAIATDRKNVLSQYHESLKFERNFDNDQAITRFRNAYDPLYSQALNQGFEVAWQWKGGF